MDLLGGTEIECYGGGSTYDLGQRTSRAKKFLFDHKEEREEEKLIYISAVSN